MTGEKESLTEEEREVLAGLRKEGRWATAQFFESALIEARKENAELRHHAGDYTPGLFDEVKAERDTLEQELQEARNELAYIRKRHFCDDHQDVHDVARSLSAEDAET